MCCSDEENDDDDDDGEENDENMDTTEGAGPRSRNPDDEFNFADYDDEGNCSNICDFLIDFNQICVFVH